MANKTMNEFLQQVGTLLYRYLRKRGLTHEDAEDIVQDTCYKFLLHQNGIGADHMTSWLYRVATNQFYDLKRKERRYQAADVDADSLLSLTHMPEMSYLQKEQRASIREALDTLSPLHQELLILKYELELTYNDLSALFNMNQNTLKTHMKRAREKMVKQVKEEFDL